MSFSGSELGFCYFVAEDESDGSEVISCFFGKACRKFEFSNFANNCSFFPSKEEAKLSLEINLSFSNQTNISSKKQPVCCKRRYSYIGRAQKQMTAAKKVPTRD
ncbi:hypothetical protein CEXT_433251 [Caerostris extrusa]|uniref:Uncharacterized protein n=1 Tax=Caerostris extrusa TaxID=172846 RepID=A0AAV4NAF8_CAEEX|nr:hypothetical protein CEXT_433251 [Caerostris extrusa]